MAATDQNYRNPKTLDIVFAVSCVLLLVSTFWMFAQDYYRPFKDVQRKFRDVEAALNERLMLAQLPEGETFDAAREAVAEARKKLDEEQAAVADIKQELQAELEQRDNAYRAVKADYDSLYSYYYIDVEHLGKAEAEQLESEVEKYRKTVETRRAQLAELEAKLRARQDELDETKAKIREQIEERLRKHTESLADAEREFKELTGAFDRFAKASAQKTWKLGDSFRNLPIIDGFAAPTKINQYHLKDLTIDYGGFEDVPRYDRCSTCHLGIERGIFDKASLTALNTAPEGLQEKLDKAEEVFTARRKAGEELNFDPSDLPGESSSVPWIVGLIVIALSILGSAALCYFVSVKLGTGVGVAGTVLGLVLWGGLAWAIPTEPVVKTVELSNGEVTQYAAHPRLDLFVDANSPHKAEDFGCTICHEGQGSATDFFNAAHSPDNFEEEEEWKKKHHWHRSHYWDFPMLPHRFVESSCLKCHHDVTDLIRDGSREEAPKVLRGFRLAQDNGCFGCHEISGYSKGRAVGPDLRLEPSPALDYLTPAMRDQVESDKANPPGTYRKAGPSLRRFAEKSNAGWAAAWIAAPRGFRPDTRMPHFYGLSTNTKEAIEAEAAQIKDETLKNKILVQARFPHTEIHSIAHYLVSESKGHLGLLPKDEKDNPNGSDVYRNALRKQIKKLQDKLAVGPIAENERRDLEKATRLLWELALSSVPTRASLINDGYARMESLQKQIHRLHEREEDVAETAKALGVATENMLSWARPVPVSQEIRNSDGNVIQVPEMPQEGPARTAHLDKGKQLFTEKGCLACHAHKGTEVRSEANFAPELSQIAAKLAPAVEGGNARRWLVQWIVNPNYHAPRTRMPITHLNADEAAAVADWLLSQPAEGWDQQQAEPEKPSQEDLIRLARVYLAKAPGFTPSEVDEYLPDPDTEGEAKGIPEPHLNRLTFDADEHVLARVTEDNLKWYIGKKALGRMGCFGCHDIPGFEQAKPIGTGLADWGKKDPARLAFEDAATFAKTHYHVVPMSPAQKRRMDELENRAELTEREQAELDELEAMEPWEEGEEGKAPYEEFFFEALEHHHREGFLYQKLLAPRSYDYRRLRTWDDRLRMPQFKFARSRQRPGESDEDFKARQTLEEAEAREAVMTFVLGLLAEPIPLKYVAQHDKDRLAEVHGRLVLEKYNCAGCHQLRAGYFEFEINDASRKALEVAHSTVSDVDPANAGFPRTDHVFPHSNAWVSNLQTGKVVVRGVHPQSIRDEEIIQALGEEGQGVKEVVTLTLTEALTYQDADGKVNHLPAGEVAWLVGDQLQARNAPWGGTFTDLMLSYAGQHYGTRLTDADKQRSALPPPLIRQGERVQTRWLHNFLRDPGVIRPPDWMLLRMPKFNMSDEEATKLVDYFAAVSKRQNPGVGVTYPYLNVPQLEEAYWKARSEEYVARLKKENKLEERVKNMKPIWEKYAREQLAAAESRHKLAEQTLKEAMKGMDAAAQTLAQEAVTRAQAEVDRWKKMLQEGTFAELRKRWEEQEVYATDGYRLLTGLAAGACLGCHHVGERANTAAQGPNLALTAERLRPEWTFQWIANPKRLFPYVPNMPANLPREPVQYQEFFVGDSREQARAIRDVLMHLNWAEGLPGVRYLPAATAAGGGN